MGRLEIPHSVQVPRGTIQIWNGLLSDIPQNWILCDGNFVTADLQAHLRLDNTALDETANNNDGTWTGTETYSTTNKIVGSHSGTFNGSSRINLANEGNFDKDFNQVFSMSSWIINSNSGTEIIAGKRLGTGGAQTGYNFFVNINNKIVFDLGNGTDEFTAVSISDILRDGKPHLVVCTYAGLSNRNGMKIYIDGVLDVTATALVTSGSMLNNDTFAIGAAGTGNAPFTGQIDDVRFYDKALNIHDVRKLYLNPPDLTSRFIRGVPTATTEPGSTAGIDTHVLLTAELPSHTHTFTESPHNHTLTLALGTGGTGTAAIDAGSSASGAAGGPSTTTVSTGGSVNNTGSDSSHENRPVFLQEAYIIKV